MSLFTHKTPKDNKEYIGLEIECFARLPKGEDELLKKLRPLSSFLNVGSDGSIEYDSEEVCSGKHKRIKRELYQEVRYPWRTLCCKCDSEYKKGTKYCNECTEGEDCDCDSYVSTFEFRLLLTKDNYIERIKQFFNVINQYDFKVNDSCGMHVHLDRRNIKSFTEQLRITMNLLQSQPLLFSFNEERFDNGYCGYVEPPKTLLDIESCIPIDTHETAIDITSKKTWEIRLHRGCLDYKRIINYITLLLKIKHTKEEFTNPIKSFKDVAKYIKITKKEKEFWKSQR